MKLLARFALLGLAGGLLGASFSMPAAAAVSDAHTDYAGVASRSASDLEEAYVYEYLYVYCDDYIYYYRYEYGAVEEVPTSQVLTQATSDRIFDR
ncbi:hypothetical protein JRI60_09955 [Archangium violaceum]|uniref:hypothetical protein n=1 Tax=Archangium violaceum TaxID=83451 RepID=UPI001952763A|nr:hypothetical protein [Archangium violaceum]QRN99313.1 hypothetical protein JRI60_09955 [Archangium violaceum]